MAQELLSAGQGQLQNHSVGAGEDLATYSSTIHHDEQYKNLAAQYKSIIRAGVPGGLYGGPMHEGDLPQGGDQSAVTRHWNWRPGETEHPEETNIHLNRRGEEVRLHENDNERKQINPWIKIIDVKKAKMLKSTYETAQLITWQKDTNLQEEVDMWEQEV